VYRNKTKTANVLIKIALKGIFSQLLLSNSETDDEISKTHAENKLKYVSIRIINYFQLSKKRNLN